MLKANESRFTTKTLGGFMEAIVSKLIPFVITIIMLVAMMLLVMGVGWASGKIIRKLFGLGGN